MNLLKYIWICCASFFCCSLQLFGQHTFTQYERNHIRIHTPGLFDGKSRLEIPLELLADSGSCFPLPGAKVISPFGGRRGHSGADIKTKANDTIRAAFDGVVRMSKSYGAYGKVIVIRHPNGLETVYSHNVKNMVEPGDTVKAGQFIALTGRTGRATTEHLHFEVRINGQAINPSLVFDMNGYTLKRHTLVCVRSGNKVKVTIKKEEENSK